MTEDYLEGYGIAPPDGAAYSSNEEYQAAFDAWFAGFEAYIFQLGAEEEAARLAAEEEARQAEEARTEREQIPDPSDRYSVGTYVGEFPQEGVVYDPRSVGSYVDEDGNLRTADGELFSPGTTPAMEPVAAAEPVTGEPVIDTALLLVDLLDALTGEEGMTDDVDGIQQTVDEIRQALDRPLMTTSFQDYTVTEGLLLLLLLSAFVAACARMLKEGFSWLK